MSGNIDAAGAALTAGLVGATIEGRDPAHGEAAHGACANCGAEIAGKFCAACGQPVHIHRTLGHMVEELLHGVFHFDTRAWKTLPQLLFRPGTLTRSYIHGKRTRYISPLAMYLLAIFAMFLGFSLVGGGEHNGVMTRETHLKADRALVAADFATVGRMEAVLGKARAWAVAAKPEDKREAEADVREAEKDLAEAQKELAQARTTLKESTNATPADVSAAAPAANPPAPTAPAATPPTDASSGLHVGIAPQGPPVQASVRGDDGRNFIPLHGESMYDAIARSSREGKFKAHTGWPYLDRKLEEKARNPQLFVYELQRTVSEFSFLLVPISLPFMWLLFAWKRGLTLFDHAVFILYSLSFVSLLAIAALLLGSLPGAPGWVTLGVVVALPVHNFFHLKGAYALGWFSAAWRTVALLFISLFCLVLFLGTMLVVGLVE